MARRVCRRRTAAAALVFVLVSVASLFNFVQTPGLRGKVVSSLIAESHQSGGAKVHTVGRGSINGTAREAAAAASTDELITVRVTTDDQTKALVGSAQRRDVGAGVLHHAAAERDTPKKRKKAVVGSLHRLAVGPVFVAGKSSRGGGASRAQATQKSASGHDRTNGGTIASANNSSITASANTTNADLVCSCHNVKSNYTCCERTFRPTHKMGFYATLSLVQKLAQIYGPRKILMMHGYRRLNWPNFGRVENDVDYRDVVVTRNVYAALVSGYLYHRTGRECHLDPHGKPWETRVDDLLNFDRYLSGTLGTPLTIDPPIRNRTLCEYLADETEEAGMKVYVDWAFTVYYQWLLGHYDFARSSEERRGKTLFVCYEKLTGTQDDLRDLLWRTYDLFFPSGGLTKIKIKPEGGREGDHTHGGHATDRDPNLRGRLQGLVVRFDKEYFDEMVAKFQSTFKCG